MLYLNLNTDMWAIEEIIKEYPLVTGTVLLSVTVPWEKARMRALSALTFEELNRFLDKIDRHFEKILKAITKKNKKAGTSNVPAKSFINNFLSFHHLIRHPSEGWDPRFQKLIKHGSSG